MASGRRTALNDRRRFAERHLPGQFWARCRCGRLVMQLAFNWKVYRIQRLVTRPWEPGMRAEKTSPLTPEPQSPVTRILCWPPSGNFSIGKQPAKPFPSMYLGTGIVAALPSPAALRTTGAISHLRWAMMKIGRHFINQMLGYPD